MRSAPHTRGSLATLTLALSVLLGPIALTSARDHEAAPAAAPTGSLVQPRGPDGCIHRTGTSGCARGRFVASPVDVAVSPDGRFGYVASAGSHSIAVFRRSRRTGELTQLGGRRGCVHHQQPDDFRASRCSRARALGGPSALAISPDGATLYATAASSDSLAVFARSRRTGALRQLPGASGCLSARPGGGCTPARALNEPTSVAVSPDGRRVYVAGRRFPSAIAVLTRNADGSLSQAPGPAGCVSHLGGGDCRSARGLSGPEEVAVTPDGRHVLVAADRSNAVVVLSSGPDGLTQAEGADGCMARRAAEGCAAGTALRGAVDLAISPDGLSVYVAASRSDAIAILGRNRTTGVLSQASGSRGCVSQDGGGRCARGRALDEVWGIALSPDGRNLYAVSPKVNMLGAMARDRTTGRLVQLPGRYACFIRAGGLGCPAGRGLTVAVAATVSPDGKSVYVASEDIYLGAVGIFRRLGR